jgi:hypothetical protein
VLATSYVGYSRYPTLLCSLGNILALIDLVMFFRKQSFLASTINMRPCRQNLGLVEAKNFVPYIWAPGT